MICGMTYFQICLYFLIYSFGGWVVEVIFHAVALGKVINRGFLNGPVCPVYGFGVLSVFALLNTIQGSGRQMSDGMIFVFGIVLATAVELVAGWLLDVCFHARWWDYSNKKFNINGRICFTFSLFWGLLALYLIRHFNPIIDKLIDKIKAKVSINYLKALVIVGIIFLAIDGILTAFALKLFFERTVYSYNLDVINKEKYINSYERVLEMENTAELANKVFSDKKMLRTFPNLKLKAQDGELIYMSSIYTDIQPYYYKFNF